MIPKLLVQPLIDLFLAKRETKNQAKLRDPARH
jgi:hypothetical protein